MDLITRFLTAREKRVDGPSRELAADIAARRDRKAAAEPAGLLAHKKRDVRKSAIRTPRALSVDAPRVSLRTGSPSRRSSTAASK